MGLGTFKIAIAKVRCGKGLRDRAMHIIARVGRAYVAAAKHAVMERSTEMELRRTLSHQGMELARTLSQQERERRILVQTEADYTEAEVAGLELELCRARGEVAAIRHVMGVPASEPEPEPEPEPKQARTLNWGAAAASYRGRLGR